MSSGYKAGNFGGLQSLSSHQDRLKFFLNLITYLALMAPGFSYATHSALTYHNPNVAPDLDLSRQDIRYNLSSLSHSSGFIVAPKDLELQQAPRNISESRNFGLKPDFQKHNRYWIYTQVSNHTNNRNWMLHISNFGFQQPKVLVRGNNDELLYTFNYSSSEDAADINTIGQAIQLDFQPNKTYQLIIELSAENVTWHPYISLMSSYQYEIWKIQMDFAFKLAIGAILGLILLAFICWIISSESAFLWAASSSLLMLIYYLEHSNLPAILWHSTYEKTAIFWILVSFTILSQLAFAASFLKVYRSPGLWSQTFLATFAITIIIGLASMTTSFENNTFLYSINYILAWIVIIGSGITKLRNEGRYYIIYMLGWLPLALSTLEVILTSSGLHQPSDSVNASYKIITVLYIQILHMLLHAIALIMLIKALREEKIKTEFISQAKSLFIAQSSHDLSQPLNAMRLFLGHLKPHIKSQEGRNLFLKLRRSHEQMCDSFKAIMDLSKFEAGVIKPEFKAISLSSLFSSLENEFNALADEKGLTLRFHPCSLIVLSDPILLERLLRNLISNAIKYTENGKIVVGCRRRGHNDVAIHVLDTGCGIEQQAQLRIFDIYHRSNNGSSHSEGSGIGLSIVKHISELMEHPIHLRSTPGRGTNFAIVLRRLPNKNAEVPVNKDTLSIAIVIDDEELKSSLALRLNKWHYVVHTFNTIDAAVSNSTPFSLLICDHPALNAMSIISANQSLNTTGYLAACICSPRTPLPQNWIALSSPLQPLQLRVLLNNAERKQLEVGFTPSS